MAEEQQELPGRAAKVEAISNLLRGMSDDQPKREKRDSPDRGANQVQERDEAHLGPESAEQLFSPQPVPSVENTPEVEADAATGGAQPDGGTQDNPDPVEEPFTVKKLAENLGLEAKDVYEELVIPLGDDQSVTLGEWKDRVKSLQDVDAERDQVTELRNEYEKNLMATRTELNAIIEVIPAEMRQTVLDIARERSGAYKASQEEAVLQAIPAWQDQDTLAKDRAGIVEMGSEYGFSEQEITYTQDARTLRMLHDYLRLRERVKQMDIASKRKPGKPNQPAANNAKRLKSRKLESAFSQAKQSTDSRDKTRLISELIRSQ